MNNYRIRDIAHARQIIEEGESEKAINVYVRDNLPPDRKGLIAVYHPLIEYTGDFLDHIHRAAEAIAMEHKRPVFMVMTETRWRLILFGEPVTDQKRREDFGLENWDDEEHIWYDSYENGEYANDQFVGHYDPDGSWHVDSVS
jgi:hypothetical protein